MRGAHRGLLVTSYNNVCVYVRSRAFRRYRPYYVALDAEEFFQPEAAVFHNTRYDFMTVECDSKSAIWYRSPVERVGPPPKLNGRYLALDRVVAKCMIHYWELYP